MVFLFGEMNNLLLTLVFFIVTEFFTKLLYEAMNHNVSLKLLNSMISNKIFILLLVAIAHTLDYNVLFLDNTLKNAIIFFYLSNEGISILQNISFSGVVMPDKIKKILISLKEKDDEEK
ncbi:hypothetical protein T23_20830 [Turicibacter faecis]|uniref:Holin n=1 Tax=Turicibacter faecis TaxID=2963365 RepID=A0ABM8IL19_9FIRM|nr:hypothetical protein T23_20830 [Turicibacter sp. TC023]